MNKANERRQSPRAERTAKTLRGQLELEFVAIHQRRVHLRRVARMSAVASLICVAAIGIWIAANYWPGGTNPSAQLAQAVNSNRPSANAVDNSQSHSPVATSGSNYSMLKVIDLSDEELRSLLASTKAQWFVAEIDGKPTAFPLEPSPRKPTPSSSLN